MLICHIIYEPRLLCYLCHILEKKHSIAKWEFTCYHALCTYTMLILSSSEYPTIHVRLPKYISFKLNLITWSPVIQPNMCIRIIYYWFCYQHIDKASTCICLQAFVRNYYLTMSIIEQGGGFGPVLIVLKFAILHNMCVHARLQCRPDHLLVWVNPLS